MSHELRTPLNHIIGFTELVAEKRAGGLNETQEEYLRDVLSSSRHLLSLINDILDISKVEAGKDALEPSEFDLRELLEKSITMISAKAKKHAITLSTEIRDLPEKITADKRKLKQIMYNLLYNAVKFTPDGGAMALSARFLNGCIEAPAAENSEVKQNDSYVEITVSDTGIGISPDDVHRIFEPFEQVRERYTMAHLGTGLGLSLTKKFVELHGGRIRAASDGPGRGSTFIFSIPVRG